jgi:toxin ParE1/3/4
VSKKALPIRWDRLAKASLDEIYAYIAEQESPEVGKHVKESLIDLAESLNPYPRKYPEEPVLKDEEEEYRYAVKWSYKLIYEITEDALIIVDVFHTKQDPGKLKDKLSDQ